MKEDIKVYDRNDFLCYEYHKRKFDGKVEKLAKILDRDNTYTYEMNGVVYQKIPTKWIVIDVLSGQKGVKNNEKS